MLYTGYDFDIVFLFFFIKYLKGMYIWSENLLFSKLTEIYHRVTFSSADWEFDIYFFYYFFLVSFLTNLVPQCHVFKTDSNLEQGYDCMLIMILIFHFSKHFYRLNCLRQICSQNLMLSKLTETWRRDS